MYEFLIVLGVIFTIFAGLIVWFMKHEEDKAWNYHSKRAQDLSRNLKAAHDVIDKSLEVITNHDKEIKELRDHNATTTHELNKVSLNYIDSLDNIAKALGRRVTMVGWIEKTLSGKMAYILKKIEKL